MFTVLSNTRNSHPYAILALAITLILISTFAFVPSIAAPKPADIPVTGSQNAYVEFLRSEKTMYANPIGLREALTAYHPGEKAIYAESIALDTALYAWRFGEKTLSASTDLNWLPRPDLSHLGEKNVAPPTYRSPLDECFDVPLREVAQCRNAIQAPAP
jgi:hypothetical protein